MTLKKRILVTVTLDRMQSSSPDPVGIPQEQG